MKNANKDSRPAIITLLIVLSIFGTCMSLLAAITLLFPGPLDVVWRVNPRGHEGFLKMGNWSFLILGTVCAGCAACATGLLRRKLWGYWLSVLMIAGQLIGDAFNVFVLKEYRAVIGLPIAGLALWLLVSPKTRAFFEP